MLIAMEKPQHDRLRLPEHDATHGLITVRLFSYRCRVQAHFRTGCEYRDVIGEVGIEDGT
jgi:hypothetical protein